MLRFKYIVLVVLCLVGVNAAAGDTTYQEIEGIVVTASRTSMTFFDPARTVAVRPASEISLLPARSFSELLQGTIGVDIRQRGVPGIQADIGVRGGTFEQTLILLDGIKISDPQTGHHNLNIPVAIDDIERVEILKGPGSRLFGPGAMTGVVNLISRKPSGRSFRLSGAAGQYGLTEWDLAAAIRTGPGSHRLSVSRRSSTGYRDNTEYDINNYYYSGRLTVGAARFDLTAGLTEKDFGAYKFYSDRFPDEWESTRAGFIAAGSEWQKNNVKLNARVFRRRHDDDFILDRNNPDFYHNAHQTDQTGAEFQAGYMFDWITLTVGGEIAEEEISSNSLGNHRRTRAGFFVETPFYLFNRLSVVPGAMLYKYSDYQWDIWPGVDIGYHFGDKLLTFLSLGRSFRMPTFTDLYYVSPANVGNPELQPEKALAIEVGARWQRGKLTLEAAYFHRWGESLIDWARPVGGDVWQVMNISESVTDGLEIGGMYKPEETVPPLNFNAIRWGYAYLDTERKMEDAEIGAYDSKYVREHLRHQFRLEIIWHWTPTLTQSWQWRYHKRMTGEEYAVHDTKISARIKNMTLFIAITNLFDKDYHDFISIPAPGRWVRAGFSWEISD